ncbi:unnamed protein product [Penicillium bialowiezense]
MADEQAFPQSIKKLCSEVHLGDFLFLQGHPCQVIRISQYRYLGTDFFTKQLHEESSFMPKSESEQTILAIDFKAWSILDLSDGYATAMDEKSDVKMGVPVIDAGNLWTRMQKAFESGRGSLKGLVFYHDDKPFILEMKVEYGEES